MSRPLRNSPYLPPALRSSAVARPFTWLSGCSSDALQHWFASSKLLSSVNALYQVLASPLQRFSQPWSWLHQGLAGLHGLGLAMTFLLTTFASTEWIGAAVVGTFGIVLLRTLLRPSMPKPTIIDVLVTLFFVTAVISGLFSSYVATSLVGLAKFSIFYMGYLNARYFLGEKPAALIPFLSWLLFLGVAESLIGFYQYINHVQPLATWQDPGLNPEDQLTRIFGTLKPSNPNLLAGFLIPTFAAGVVVTFYHLTQSRWWIPFLTGCLTFLVLLALVLTGSRGAYLSILGMGMMIFMFLGHLLWHEPTLKERYQLKALWMLLLIGAGVAAIGAMISLPAIRNRVLSIFAMREDSSNSYRMNVWQSTIAMIRDNWLVGIGPGNDTFKQVYGLYMVPGYNALSAYSIFLEIWAEQGIAGILLFILLCIAMVFRTLYVTYSALSLETKIIVGLLLVGIVGSVIYGLFDTIWYRPSVNLLFWFFVAALSVYSEQLFSKVPFPEGADAA